MSIERLLSTLRSTVTSVALLILFAISSGCASTTDPLAYPAQCPKPEQPDDRLKQIPCEYVAVSPDMSRVELEAATINNNKCALQNRDRYLELQNWVKGRVQ